MSRPLAAALMGIGFVLLYIAAASSLADVLPDNGVVQAVYFLVAGVLWVVPVIWLLRWSVRRR